MTCFCPGFRPWQDFPLSCAVYQVIFRSVSRCTLLPDLHGASQPSVFSAGCGRTAAAVCTARTWCQLLEQSTFRFSVTLRCTSNPLRDTQPVPAPQGDCNAIFRCVLQLPVISAVTLATLVFSQKAWSETWATPYSRRDQCPMQCTSIVQAKESSLLQYIYRLPPVSHCKSNSKVLTTTYPVSSHWECGVTSEQSRS